MGMDPAMTKARGATKRELEAVRADPSKDDTEGTTSEDRWFGRGRHGWFDRLLHTLRRA